MEDAYHNYLMFDTRLGSSAIDSYLRAMEMIDRVLITSNNCSIWDIHDEESLRKILDIIKAAKLNPISSIFRKESKFSYLESGFCEAALRWYMKFVVEERDNLKDSFGNDFFALNNLTKKSFVEGEQDNGYPDIVYAINDALEHGCTDAKCTNMIKTGRNGNVVWEKVFCRSMGGIRFKSDAWGTFRRFKRQTDVETRLRLIWKTCKEIGLINVK